METATLTLIRYFGICDNGHSFTVHDFSDFEYGRMLIRATDLNEIGFIDGFNDTDFDEMADIVKGFMQSAAKGNYASDCFHKIFGELCDPAPSGTRYEFGGNPRCPICGSKGLVRYGPSDLTDNVQVPYVTYAEWRTLKDEARQNRIKSALIKEDCL